MKLNSPGANPGGRGGNGQNEKRDARIARMRGYWTTTPTLYALGTLLKEKITYTIDGVERQGSVALALTEGAIIELTEVTLPNGRVVPVEPAQVLALCDTTGKVDSAVQTVSDKTRGFGCPACNSMHGSGIYPSSSVNVKELERNAMYYDPRGKRVLSISNTCWKEYVVGLGFDNLVKVPSRRSQEA